jgi:alpha-tubulin suppressor-like RCC1 family protein
MSRRLYLFAFAVAWLTGANGIAVAQPKTGSAPRRQSRLTHVVMIAGGQAHNLALLSDGTVCGWGDNTDGQLGNGPAW